MQEITKKDFSKLSSESKLNSSACIDVTEDENKCLKIDEEKPKSGSNSEKAIVHERIKSSSKHKPHCRACGGKVRKSSEDTPGGHLHRKECNYCEQTYQNLDEKPETLGKDFCTTNVDRLHSGHAKTHSIVINLDDNSRFTDEVTV